MKPLKNVQTESFCRQFLIENLSMIDILSDDVARPTSDL